MKKWFNDPQEFLKEKKIDAYRTGVSKPSFLWARSLVRNSSEYSFFKNTQISILAMDKSLGSDLHL